MTMPKFEDFLLPTLKIFADSSEHTTEECQEKLKSILELTEADINEMLPSKSHSRLQDRTWWALVYLNKATLIDKTNKKTYRINNNGLSFLANNPEKLTRKMLIANYPSFAEFARPKDNSSTPEASDDSDKTPEEIIENAYHKHIEGLVEDVKDYLSSVDPFHFEQIVMDLLEKMGYGFSKELLNVTQKTNDEGIDGVIGQDALALDKIYVQAKRYNGHNVGREDIQKFIGALSSKKSSKGIFITTSDFNQNAIECAQNANIIIELIDGAKLAELMVKYNVGTQTKYSYEIKTIDRDYFSAS